MADKADALPIGGTVVGGALSAAGAMQQNRAVKRSIASLDRAYATDRTQTNASFGVEADKLARRNAQVLGRLRVLEAESGAIDGSFAAIETGAAVESAINQNINEANRVNQQRRLASEYVANGTRILAQQSSVPLSLITGALSGLGTGLQIQSSLDAMAAAEAAKEEQANAAAKYITNVFPV